MVNNNKFPKISIVIPVHNEADNIEFLINKIENAMINLIPYEIIIINDGSSDKTHEIIMDFNDQMENLHYIKHKKQSGQSAALLSGIEASNSDWIVTLDGDGQNDPNDIKKLLMKRDQIGSDKILLAGYRKKRKDSIYKKIQSKLANTIRSFLLPI